MREFIWLPLLWIVAQLVAGSAGAQCTSENFVSIQGAVKQTSSITVDADAGCTSGYSVGGECVFEFDNLPGVLQAETFDGAVVCPKRVIGDAWDTNIACDDTNHPCNHDEGVQYLNATHAAEPNTALAYQALAYMKPSDNCSHAIPRFDLEPDCIRRVSFQGNTVMAVILDSSGRWAYNQPPWSLGLDTRLNGVQQEGPQAGTQKRILDLMCVVIKNTDPTEAGIWHPIRDIWWRGTVTDPEDGLIYNSYQAIWPTHTFGDDPSTFATQVTHYHNAQLMGPLTGDPNECLVSSVGIGRPPTPPWHSGQKCVEGDEEDQIASRYEFGNGHIILCPPGVVLIHPQTGEDVCAGAQ